MSTLRRGIVETMPPCHHGHDRHTAEQGASHDTQTETCPLRVLQEHDSRESAVNHTETFVPAIHGNRGGDNHRLVEQTEIV